MLSVLFPEVPGFISNNIIYTIWAFRFIFSAVAEISNLFIINANFGDISFSHFLDGG